MKRYSTQQVSTFIGISRQAVHALVRAGVLEPERGARGHFEFGFRDLVVLRTAHRLLGQSLSPRRLARTMRELKQQLPRHTPLSALRILIQGDQILVREHSSTWNSQSGQLVLDFALEDLPESDPVATLSAAGAESATVANSIQAHFDQALEFDNLGRSIDAEAAYRRTLALDPRHAHAMINLGRLLHASGALAEAEFWYRNALTIDPHQVVAHFNLGVVLEDSGNIEAAMRSYRAACEIDPDIADAHFNLARLYDARGDQQAAQHHLDRFHDLRPRSLD
jgi:tetratricopeptide (TPR) repeat protein